MTIDATTVTYILAAFPVVLPIVQGIVQQLLKYIESKMSSAQLAQAEKYVGLAVTAIEQTVQDLPGENKKAQAEALISTLLKDAKVSVSPAIIDSLIEATVSQLSASGMRATTKLVPAIR